MRALVANVRRCLDIVMAYVDDRYKYHVPVQNVNKIILAQNQKLNSNTFTVVLFNFSSTVRLFVARQPVTETSLVVRLN